jgi:tRNA threonylcarbamoyl adenosine modification protein (Sua5/YciO/YrdC/YwlC family)
LLPATHEVPRRLLHPKKRRIGIRVVDNEIVRALLTELGQPLMSSTLILPGEEIPVTDAEDIRDVLDKHVDLIIDGGHCGPEPTTVINMAVNPPELVREGKGKDHGLSAD